MRALCRVAIVIGVGAIAIGMMLSLIDHSTMPMANAQSPHITIDRPSADPSGNLLINPDFENGFTWKSVV